MNVMAKLSGGGSVVPRQYIRDENNFKSYAESSSSSGMISGSADLSPPKVLIFSQYIKVLNAVGHRLLRKFGQNCIAEFYGKERHSELQKFSNLNSSCFAIIAGKDASHGLDLSFVTHIVLLEEIIDSSLKQQVIARAYRMGTKKPVICLQIVSRGSVEEMFHDLNLESKEGGGGEGRTEGGRGKKIDEGHNNLHKLLKTIRTIRQFPERGAIANAAAAPSGSSGGGGSSYGGGGGGYNGGGGGYNNNGGGGGGGQSGGYTNPSGGGSNARGTFTP